VPEGIAAMILGLVRRRELEPLVVLRTRRSGIRATENGKPVANVLVDRVAVMDGRRVERRFDELEIEAIEGGRDNGALERLASRLHEAGALPSEGRPLALRTGIVARARPAFDRQAERLRAAIEAQVEALLRHDPGTRLGLDAEELHDFRVATRRLRAILRAAGPLVERAWAEELRTELAWLGSAVGPVRDLDVLLEHLQAEVAALGGDETRSASVLVPELVGRRAEARATLLAALESDRYLALLDRLEDEASRTPPLLAVDVSLHDLAAAEFAGLRKAAEGTSATAPDERLHRLRIRVKRARYAAELAGKDARTVVARAKELQDVIGDHQDAVVAEKWIRSLLPADADTRLAFAAGRLVERERERRRDARAAFPKAWKRLERAGATAFS
jgi:CHAD domain-containing protein